MSMLKKYIVFNSIERRENTYEKKGFDFIIYAKNDWH